MSVSIQTGVAHQVIFTCLKTYSTTLLYVNPLGSKPYRNVKYLWAAGIVKSAGRSGYRIPVGMRVSMSCPEWPRGPPCLLYNECRIFLRIKRPECTADYPAPSKVGVVKVLEL